MIRWLLGPIGLCLAAMQALAADPVAIGVGYLGVAGMPAPRPPAIAERTGQTEGLRVLEVVPGGPAALGWRASSRRRPPD